MRAFRLIPGVILFSILFWNLLPGGKLLNVNGKAQLSANNFHRRILQATLQILVYPYEGETRERGIGTLISLAGEDLVLTHNHWDFLRDLRKVEILDAKGDLLVEIDATAFKDLVRYSDRGTLIFTAPVGLRAVAANLGRLQDLRAGDIITVVHQASHSVVPLDLLQAEVRTIDDYNGLPVVRFVPLDGQEIKPGDSGGGVWFEGQLIGNTWGMYFQKDKWFLPGSQEIQFSNVAQLPMYFLELFDASQTSLQTEEEPGSMTEVKIDLP